MEDFEKKSGNPEKYGNITGKNPEMNLGRLKYIIYLTKNMMRIKILKNGRF